MRHVYLVLGILSVATGAVGIFVPLLPTVPFMLLAAFFFARSNSEWERRLVEHPHFGPHIVAWREHGAISRRGKFFGITALIGSAVMGFFFLHDHWRFIPLGVALVCGTWMATRPNR
ncbi:YbaN family protein [Sphingomonas sp. AP4-R1]|uniref:YbaN family protein n=1 Tax=Sphingomonas sp. AP4-R1 TaxID=2735134 RepID=UPI0014939DDC|nr:YbaN family protein [Sphingomonas sp. AP4-R1]QJU57079.1 YbaN family protein [Sphingomonas sp. AP4-R1]